jgi:hypothetical protein
MDGHARPITTFHEVGAHFVRRVMSKRAPVTQHTSSSRARVSVMQAADLRNRSHGPALRCLDFSWNRGVAIQGQMRPRPVVIFKVLGKDSFQMQFVEYDHMIEAFSTDRPDQTFDERILPRRTRRADNFLDSQEKKTGHHWDKPAVPPGRCQGVAAVGAR